MTNAAEPPLQPMGSDPAVVLCLFVELAAIHGATSAWTAGQVVRELKNRKIAKLTPNRVSKALVYLTQQGFLKKIQGESESGRGRPAAAYQLPDKPPMTTRPFTARVLMEFDTEPTDTAVNERHFREKLMTMNLFAGEKQFGLVDFSKAISSSLEKNYLSRGTDAGLSRGPELNRQSLYLRLLAAKVSDGASKPKP